MKAGVKSDVSSSPRIRVKIEGGLWHSWKVLVRDKVIPFQWKAMNDEIQGAPKSHSVENFRFAAGIREGTY
jgi:uncharacterized protein